MVYCHPERSEGSQQCDKAEMFRCAQHDNCGKAEMLRQVQGDNCDKAGILRYAQDDNKKRLRMTI